MIKKRGNVGIKHYNDPTAFSECSNTMDDIYKDIDNYNPKRDKKFLIVFDDMSADIMTNETFQAIIKELFIRCRKLNVSLVYYSVLFFCSKRCQTKLTHYLIMKINNKRQLQNIARNLSADIDYKDFMKICRECTKEPFNFFDN